MRVCGSWRIIIKKKSSLLFYFHARKILKTTNCWFLPHINKNEAPILALFIEFEISCQKQTFLVINHQLFNIHVQCFLDKCKIFIANLRLIELCLLINKTSKVI